MMLFKQNTQKYMITLAEKFTVSMFLKIKKFSLGLYNYVHLDR